VARRRDLDAALDKNDDVQPLQQGRGLRGLVGTSGREEIDVGTETELSQSEADELGRCEAVIQRGLRTFFEVGTALLRIRELRLYRAEHATFEDYCQERWEMGRRYVNQIIAASQVRENLGAMAPKQLPENERQARPLARLEPELQRAAWQQVLEAAAAEGRITAAHVEQVVKEMIGQSAAADAFPSADETEVAPAQQEVIIEQADEDGLFSDDDPAPAAAATSPAAAPAQGDWMHLAVQTDEEEDAAAPSGEEEPWPDNLFEIEARLAEEGWERTSESETRIYYQRGDETLHLVKPPEPNVVQLRLVAHASEDMEQVMTWLHQQIGAEFPRRPASSRLPKYPERRRVYGVVAASEQRIANGHEPADAAALQDEVADLRQRLADVQSILEEYQQHITRAQNYKPTSDRGEVVSPFLRLVERVALTIQDIERKGGQKE